MLNPHSPSVGMVYAMCNGINEPRYVYHTTQVIQARRSAHSLILFMKRIKRYNTKGNTREVSEVLMIFCFLIRVLLQSRIQCV